jgi:DNA-binding Lrp family transcriptional regulator
VSNDFSEEELEFYGRLATSGLHTFVFVDHVPDPTQLGPALASLDAAIPSNDDELAERLESDGAVVLSASEFIGPFKAFIHLWAKAGDLTGTERFIANVLWPAGIGCETDVMGSSYQGPGGQIYLLKIKHCDVVAIVRIWVEKGRAHDVVNSLSKLAGFQGAATIFGGFDVLLVLEGEDLASVARVAIDDLQEISGIVRTETSFSDYCWPREGDGA